MKDVIKFEIFRHSRTLLVWCIIMSLIVVLMMSFYPMMQNSAMEEVLNAKMDAIPDSLKKSFGIDVLSDLTKIGNYFAYTFQYMLIGICIFASMFGLNSLLKEEGDGSIEFLYAQPITRSKVVTSKLIANLILVSVLVIVTMIVSMVTCAILIPEDGNLTELMTHLKLIGVSTLLTSWVYLSVGFFLSATIRNPGMATTGFFGLFFLTYLTDMISKIVEDLEFLKYVTPFHYADPSELIRHGYQYIYLILSVSIIAVSIALCHIIYRRKDLKV